MARREINALPNAFNTPVHSTQGLRDVILCHVCQVTCVNTNPVKGDPRCLVG
jgi:hypothetical protein